MQPHRELSNHLFQGVRLKPNVLFVEKPAFEDWSEFLHSLPPPKKSTFAFFDPKSLFVFVSIVFVACLHKKKKKSVVLFWKGAQRKVRRD